MTSKTSDEFDKHKLKSAHHNGVVDCAIAINRLIEEQVRGLMQSHDPTSCANIDLLGQMEINILLNLKERITPKYMKEYLYEEKRKQE